MKHIKTPVRVDYVPHSWEPFATVFVVDAEGKEVLSEPVDTSYGVNPLEHPPAVEVTRAINAHDALVGALGEARHRIQHTERCPCGITSKVCTCGALKIQQKIDVALKLARGEQG